MRRFFIGQRSQHRQSLLVVPYNLLQNHLLTLAHTKEYTIIINLSWAKLRSLCETRTPRTRSNAPPERTAQVNGSPRFSRAREPLETAEVGEEYTYQVRANRSLGDLSARMQGGDQVSGYFDVEKPKFALEQGPAWLELDEATGMLRGTPDATGKVEVTVTVTIDREVRNLDEKALVWGRENVLSTATQRVGTDTQKFVVDVQ